MWVCKICTVTGGFVMKPVNLIFQTPSTIHRYAGSAEKGAVDLLVIPKS